MKKILFSSLVFLLVLINNSAFSQDYFVCESGFDHNLGTTPSSAFKTFDKAMANFSQMGAGDTISFCRGGHFSVGKHSTLFNTRLNPDQPLIIKDYIDAEGGQGKAKPVIYSEQGVFSFNTRNKVKPDGGLVIKNLELRGQGQGQAVFFLNGFSHVTLDNLVVDGFLVGISVGSGANESRDLLLKNSVIKNNAEQGWLGGGSQLLIENNFFKNNGFSGKNASFFYHNIYISNSVSSIPATQIQVQHNVLYQSAMNQGKCGGVSLVMHGKLNQVTVNDNAIIEDLGAVSGYCYGIAIGPGYAEDEFFRNVEIVNNTLLNVGRVGILGSALVGGLIKGNTLVDQGEVLAEGIAILQGSEKDGDETSRDITITQNTVLMNDIYARAIKLDGHYPLTVTNNEFSLGTKVEQHNCILAKGVNEEIDITTNGCQRHDAAQLSLAVQALKESIDTDYGIAALGE